MARDHARIDVSIWVDDDDFVALSDSAQRLYFFLLSQQELSYAGLLPMRLKRWASRSSTSTVDSITAALAELDASRFVVCDHDAEEVLVRSLIRRDGIYKQPNVLLGALRESFEITSPVLRAALADELYRLPVEVTGPAPGVAAAALLTGTREMPPPLKAAVDGRRKARTRAQTVPAPVESEPVPPAAPAPAAPPVEQQDDPHPEPVIEPVPEGSENPSRNPSGNPSPNPSAKGLGEGGRGYGVVSPLTFRSTQVHGVPRAREHAHAGEGARAREEAARLVELHMPDQPDRVAGRLTGEVARLLGEDIDPQHIGAGLRLWAGKRLGTGLLAELVGEAMREPLIAHANRPRSRTDDAVGAALELARRCAIEDNDQTPFGRMLRGETDPGDGPVSLGGFMADAGPALLGAAS